MDFTKRWKTQGLSIRYRLLGRLPKNWNDIVYAVRKDLGWKPGNVTIYIEETLDALAKEYYSAVVNDGKKSYEFSANFIHHYPTVKSRSFSVDQARISSEKFVKRLERFGITSEIASNV